MDTMDADRKLDVAVAKLLGWGWYTHSSELILTPPGSASEGRKFFAPADEIALAPSSYLPAPDDMPTVDDPFAEVPHYSSNPVDFGKVYNYMWSRGYRVIRSDPRDPNSDLEFTGAWYGRQPVDPKNIDPYAGCVAALKACGCEVPV